MRITITYTGLCALMAKSSGQLKKGLRNVHRDSLKDTVKTWRKRYLAGHFNASAVQKYGLTDRGRKYKKRKMKKFGHRRPGVFTGGGMEMVLASHTEPTASRRGGFLRASLKFKAPRHMFIRHHKGGGKAYRVSEELTRTTDSENAYLSEYMERQIVSRINKLPGKITRKI